jgi:diacylglycerol kinase (ATP)
VSLDPLGDCATTHRAFLLSFANGRQWGNGAIIAPSAELDDGALEAVIVEDLGRAAVLRSVPRLFAGTIAGAPGVSICRIESATVSADGPLLYHADGEPYVGGPSLRVSIRPRALRLRA